MRFINIIDKRLYIKLSDSIKRIYFKLTKHNIIQEDWLLQSQVH